ncbi:MAG: hypothetical protein HGA85_06515 [Nanoarchaeota archaeon]|nr:hypothetical protein [Nanoarchaeota archaeon]
MPESNLYKKAAVISGSCYILISIYLMIESGVYDLFTANRALADSAYILIGLSFAYSGLSYFFKLSPAAFILRKQLGIIGFVFALIHSVFSGLMYIFIPIDPIFAFDHVWNFLGRETPNVLAFLPGIASLAILVFMTAISGNAGMKWLGNRWRPALRVGYLAIFLTVFHFSIKSYSGWRLYLLSPLKLPPITLLLAVFGLAVILLRVALQIAISLKKNKKVDQKDP